MTPLDPNDEALTPETDPTPEGVGPPESIIVESDNEADVLNEDGTVKEP